eukprot:g12362.t1
MPTPDQELVTCPSCGKGYRFKPTLIGKSVTCKACGNSFLFPSQPGAGKAPEPVEDDGLYELASDPDIDEPPAPPPVRATPSPSSPAVEPAVKTTAEPAIKPAVEPPASAVQTDPAPTSSLLDTEEPAYVSDAVKAARREEQRIAAVADATEEKWWQKKWVLVAIGLLILFLIIYWAMHQPAGGPAMSDAPPERVTCPSCGKGYRWQAKLIERHVPCKACGTEFIVPYEPGVGIAVHPKPSDDGYELDIDEPESPASKVAAAHGGKCPSCNSPVREGAVICMNCGFNLAEGKKVQTAVAETPADADEADPNLTKQEQRDMERSAAAHAEHWWMDYKLPLILIGVGLAMTLLNNVLIGPNAPMIKDFYGSTSTAIIGLTIETAYITFVHSALLFVGLLLLVKLFGAGFGTLTSVLLRVLGISLVSQEAEFMVRALMDIAMGTGGFGWVVTWTVYLAFMVGLCIKLLDVDMTEFRVLIWFIIIGQIVTDYSLIIVLNIFI